MSTLGSATALACRFPRSWGAIVDPSVGVLAWVRASRGSGSFSGTLAVWQIPRPNVSTQTNFTVGESWTLITCTHDLAAGDSTIRVEFYLDGVGRSLDIDSVILT